VLPLPSEKSARDKKFQGGNIWLLEGVEG